MSVTALRCSQAHMQVTRYQGIPLHWTLTQASSLSRCCEDIQAFQEVDCMHPSALSESRKAGGVNGRRSAHTTAVCVAVLTDNAVFAANAC